MTKSEYTNEQLIDFMYNVMDWSDIEDAPMIYAVIDALECKRQVDELQAQNALLSERDAAIEEKAIARFVNWVDDHYNTEIHLERTDEYKTIHDFYEEFMDEVQRKKEEERD